MIHSAFHAKVRIAIVIVALPFVVLLLTTFVMERRVDTELDRIEQRYLPRLESAPKLAAAFEGLGRSLQDAVAARDTDALERCATEKDKLFSALAETKGAFEPSDVETARAAIDVWYATGVNVARRLIAGETGEALVETMSAMQRQRATARRLLDRLLYFDRGEMTQAFAEARAAQTTGKRVHLSITVTCLVIVLLGSSMFTRRVVPSLDALRSGFERFGRGDFSKPIDVVHTGELTKLAKHANSMATNLEALAEEQEGAASIQRALANLAQQVGGELTPAEVAQRAVQFVAKTIDVPCAALYVANEDAVLAPEGRHGVDGPMRSFAPGEGLVGQAALEGSVTMLCDLPSDYLHVTSGLGTAKPVAVILVPLVHDAKVSGVLEIATLKPWTAQNDALVGALREPIAVAIEVARARVATKELLDRSSRLTAQLQAQEEELRARNEELHVQQEELRQTNEELTEYATQLEEQRQELEDARHGLEVKARELATVSAYKSQFLANMSHELRTPLNSMLLLSKLLSDNASRNLTEKQIEWAATVHAAGNDLLALINDVLDLAKVEAGKQEIHSKDVSLARLVEHAQRVFSPLAQKKGLELSIDLAPDLPEKISTDEQRLMQILTNLIGNAIKFTDRGSVKLEIRSVASGGIAFAVRDTGHGIRPEHRERIFAPFEQVDGASDRRHGGTGLGLTIARQLAELLGGTLSLTSTVGTGSTFILVLPLVPSQPTTARASIAPPTRSDETDLLARLPPKGHDYVLVIEDDLSFSGVVGGIVEEHGLGYVAAMDGEIGLTLAMHRKPRAIILDVRLPGVDGWTVMERLRRDPTLSHVPVHFISGTDDKARGLEMGAVGFLTKPASRQALVTVVESLLAKGAAPIKVLVVAHEDESAARVQAQLRREGLAVTRVTTFEDALSRVSAESFACVVLDPDLPDGDGIALVDKLVDSSPIAPAIVVTTSRPLDRDVAKRLEASAVVVVRDGAYDTRLMDEVRLFVRRIREGLAPSPDRGAPLPTKDVRLEGKHVLVVDDDMRTLYALSATLRAKGMKVVSADNGRAALAALDAEPTFDVVLMDVMMPEMDGYEAMGRIREDARFRALPIIALTAKAMKGDRERCLEVGATDYLPKPVDVDRLLALLMAILAPSRPSEHVS